MKYELGSKQIAITELIRCAIQDRKAFADCHKDQFGMPISADDKKTIKRCELTIRDFKKLGKTMLRHNLETEKSKS